MTMEKLVGYVILVMPVYGLRMEKITIVSFGDIRVENTATSLESRKTME